MTGVEPIIVGLFGCFIWAGIEAWRDKTPMRPFQWKRPELAWWAGRRTAREKLNGYISVKKAG